MARGSFLQPFIVLFLVLTAIYVAHNVVTLMIQVDGGYTVWSEFSQCTVTCGGGTRYRWRLCTNPVPRYGGKNCSRYGPPKQIFQCNQLPCPVHGGYGSWGDFSPCSKSCGAGLSKRIRQCDNPKPQFGGKSCKERELGPDEETKMCNTHTCPVDGGYGEWSEFGTCTVTCGGGMRTRTRVCNQPVPQHGGKNCSEQTQLGPSSETKVCNSDPCPVNGRYGAWGSFGACSVTCGAGTQVRMRKCDNPEPKHGGKDCEGPDSETMSCSAAPCPVDGGYSAWSAYSSCSVTCGEGTQQRQRMCSNPPPSAGGKTCIEGGLGPATQTVACLHAPCTQNKPTSSTITKEAQSKPSTEKPVQQTNKEDVSKPSTEKPVQQKNREDVSEPAESTNKEDASEPAESTNKEDVSKPSTEKPVQQKNKEDVSEPAQPTNKEDVSEPAQTTNKEEETQLEKKES